MASLTDAQKISRLFSNEEKFETFINTNDNYLTTDGQFVDSLLTMVQTFKNLYNTIINRGAWVSGTTYAVNNIFSNSGTWYITLVSHTSGTFATDLAASKFQVYQGITAASLAASNGSSLVGYIDPNLGAVLQTQQSKIRKMEVTPFDFGGIGDGVADDTAAVISCFASTSRNISLAGGVWKVSSTINSTLANRRISGHGGSLTSATADLTCLSISGANTHVSIDIDGNNKIAKGVYVTANNCIVENCNFKNIKGVATNAAAVYFNNVYGTVRSCDIDTVDGGYNSILGDGIGSSRAILFFTDHDVTGKITIDDCRIINVIGDDGDSIHLQGNSISGFYYNFNAVIKSCVISNFDRRAIKLQGGGVKVLDCYITQTAGALSNNGNDVVCINGFLANDIEIRNNVINSITTFNAIQVTGDATRILDGIVIEGNNIKCSTDVVGVYCDYVNSGRVSGNKINGCSSAITAGYCNEGFAISNNTISGGIAGVGYDISITSTNIGITVKDNVFMPTGGRLYAINNNCPNAKVLSNINYRTTGGNIRVNPSATGSLYIGNLNYSTSPTYAITALSDLTNQLILSSKNFGTGGTGGYAGMMVYAKESPQTSGQFTTIRFDKGDICINSDPAIGEATGWRNIGSGTPGTWETIP